MENGYAFGIPWPDCNAGLLYCDTISAKDQSKTLMEFYCSRHKQSASAEGKVTFYWYVPQRLTGGCRGFAMDSCSYFERVDGWNGGRLMHPWLGQIRVDGVVACRPDVLLSMGAGLEYHRLPWREPAAPHLLQVLHEDNHVVALNKPSGLQVLPGGLFQQRTVLTQLQWRDDHAAKSQCTDPSSTSTRSYPTSPVHRLGRGTSGILLCAKTPEAKSRLAADLAEGAEITTGRMSKNHPKKQLAVGDRSFLKTYRALASGLIEADEITIDQPIGRVPYVGVAGGLYMASATGKPSLSKVAVLLRNKRENCTLVQVEIFTGRPHQIRIHLASIGHPLLGDPLYVAGGIPSEVQGGSLAPGALQSAPLEDDGGYSRPSAALPGDIGYLLHAWRLEFYHPISEEKLLLIAPPPLSLQVPEEQGKCGDC